MNFDYRSALKNIPHKPGIYQFWDKEKELIYIGKAKDLRNRVTSYFNNPNVNGKTRVKQMEKTTLEGKKNMKR